MTTMTPNQTSAVFTAKSYSDNSVDSISPRGWQNTPQKPSPAAWNQQIDELVNKLCSFLTLEEDWDGNGASKPHPENIQRAYQWLQDMRRANATPPSSVAPGVAGEIELIWQREGIYFEAILDGDIVEWMEVIGDNPPRHFESPPGGAIIAGK